MRTPSDLQSGAVNRNARSPCGAPPPRPRADAASPDTDGKITREFAHLLWVRLVVAIAVSPAPVSRRELEATLQPELTDLSPVWLNQILKCGKKQGAFAARDGG